MTWKDVYKTTSTSCGDACEFYHYTHHCSLSPGEVESLLETQGTDTCTLGLMKLDTPTCVNIETSGADLGQWCYVSNKCKKGHKIHNGQLKWKICDAADATFENLPPFTLCDDAWNKGIAVDPLIKATYQVIPDFTWKENNNDVYKYYCGASDQTRDLSPKMMAYLAGIKKKVLVFGKEVAGEPPFIIVDLKTKSGVPEVSEVITEDAPRFQPLACPMNSSAELMPI